MSDGVRPGPGHDQVCQLAREEAAVGLLTRTELSRALRSHLHACPPCHDEYLQLAALAPLLGAVREVQPSQPPEQPSPMLLDRLLTQVGRRRQRRRRIAAGLVAAAATFAVAVPLLRLEGKDSVALPPAPSAAVSAPELTPDGDASTSPGSPAETADTTGAAPSEGVAAHGAASSARARVRLWVREVGSGSSVTAAVSLRGPVPRGHWCRMVVHTASGTSTTAGTWPMEAPESWYTEEITLPPAQIRRIEFVEVGTGRQIADVPVSRA